MKIKNLFRSALLLGALTASLRADEISWWTFTGGGGVSQYGGVALGGALGPIAPALSPATGGDYTLSGGFWPVLSGQPKATAPILKITWLGPSNQVQISWPVSVQGYTLEYTTQLGSGAWASDGDVVTDTATEHTVTVPVTGAIRCYRLRRH